MLIRNSLTSIGVIAMISICSYLGYEVYRMHRLIDAGANMSRTAQRFEQPIGDKNEILILGDSLAYGVGVSNPKESFAGALAQRFRDKSIKNHAEIGETAGSLNATLDEKLNNNYEQVFIIVGGNDIMRMHINVLSSRNSLKNVVRTAVKKADRVTLVTTGDFKNVSLVPLALKHIYSLRANIIRESALELETEHSNFDYIDFQAESIGKREYSLLEAADGYHLNEKGIERLLVSIFSENN